MDSEITKYFNKLGVSPIVDIDWEPDRVRYGEDSVRIRVTIDVRSPDNKSYHIEKFYPMSLVNDLKEREICKSLVYVYVEMIMDGEI